MISFSDYTGKISKKMNEAIAVMSFSTDGPRAVDNDKLEGKIDTVLRLIQSIRLQSPASHSGLVIIFSPISDVPFPTDAGISFSWFRIRELQGIVERVRIDQLPSTFYLPTIDDVGYKICAQFEDDYEQGLSRHLEVNPFLSVLHHFSTSVHHHIDAHISDVVFYFFHSLILYY